MSETKDIVGIRPQPMIDAEALLSFLEVYEAMKRGSVTAFVIAAKQDGFNRWSFFRAYTHGDRYNLIGQLQCVISELAEIIQADLKK